MSVTLRPWRLCKHPHIYFTVTARLLSATEPIQLTLLIDDNWFDHTFYHLKQASCSDFADRGKVVPRPAGEEEDRKGARYCDRVWTVGHVSATQFIVDHGYLLTKSVFVSDFADEFPDAKVIGTDVSPDEASRRRGLGRLPVTVVGPCKGGKILMIPALTRGSDP